MLHKANSGRLLSIFFLAAFVTVALWGAAVATEKPPVTKKDNIAETIHGVEIVDPYRWLEDQESPETRAWIDTQNEYTHSFLDKLPYRDKLEKRFSELMKIDRVGIPYERNGRYFISKRAADEDLYIIYMREGLDGQDRVLIDPHSMSADHTVSTNMVDVSRDGKILIYGVREGGEDEIAVKLLDIDSMTELPDSMSKGHYFGVSMMPDKSGFYYTRHKSEVGSRVYFHVMGTDHAKDELIFGEGYGPDKIIGAGVSEDGSYVGFIVYHGSAGQKTEVYFKDLEEDGPITPLVNDIDARFDVEMAGDKLFLETNWEAPNGRVFLIDVDNHERENWKEIIPESDAVIRGVSAAGGKLFVNYMENVTSKVKAFEPDGKYLREISFPTLGTVSGIVGQWERNEAFFVFTSFHVPTTIFRYDIAKGKQKVWYKLDVPLDSEMMQVDQVWYKSKDGTEVPMFLVHKKGIKLDGNNPTLLTGYGGFNVSLTPYFTARAVLWVELGGVAAIANLRGGGEFGEEWHRAGMFENRQNVFDDFIAAAEWLIDNKYTSTSKLAIRGGSNGGLLVGAMLAQRPELFKAVVCTYPLLDMVRYHQFLMAKFWVSEYGSSEDPDQFKYIYAYSPYHNMMKGTEYPATLFITGDSDTRVAPLHARKMTALMQDVSGSDNPILLLYDTKAGHSGGMPVSKQIEDSTDEMSFLLWQLGM